MKVSPTGPGTSNIMVITDYCDPNDTRGVLTGSHAFMFEKMLENGGIKRPSLYVTSCCLETFQFPKKITKPKRLKMIAENSREPQEIKKEIHSIKPNVIFALGEWALQILCNQSDLRKFQGSILKLSPVYAAPQVKVIPIQHPRDIYKDYAAFYYSAVFLKRGQKYKDDPYEHRERLHLHIARSYSDVKNYVESFKHTTKFVVCDIETYGNLISCIGISMSKTSAVTIPILEDIIPRDELIHILKLLQRVFYNLPVVNQNVVFDHERMERFGFVWPRILGDTMLNMSALYCELPKNLGFQVSIFTELPYHKDEAKDHDTSEELYLYCGKDCASTYQIYLEQQAELDEKEVRGVVDKILMPSYFIYKEMQQRGLQVDSAIKQEKIDKYEMLRISYESELNNLLGRTVNPLSPKQCTDLVYEELGLPKQKKRRADGTYTATADETALETLMLNHVSNEDVARILSLLIYIRKIYRILDYINIPLNDQNIWFSSFNLTGTESGRTSSGKSAYRRYYLDEAENLRYENIGGAFQTIPKHGFELPDGSRLGDDIREMFVPRPGYVFCEGDQAKAEAVIVTILAKDFDLYHRFYESNLHKETAAKVFSVVDGKPYTEDDITPDQYNKGKRVRHAANYDMGAGVLSQQALCSRSLATAILSAFHKEYWKVRQIFHTSIQQELRRHLALRTPWGRVRDFLGNPNSHGFFKEGYSYIPQSVVADKTKYGMIETKKALEGKVDCHFLGESHDSILAEVKKGQEEDYFKTLKKFMEEPIDMRKGSLPRDIDAVILFDCGMGEDNWKKIKEVNI